MLPTYPATLRGGVLDWGPNGPPDLPQDAAVPVHVTLLLGRNPHPDSGRKMLAALEALAAVGGPINFGDPLEWQQDVRAERPLPGRSD